MADATEVTTTEKEDVSGTGSDADRRGRVRRYLAGFLPWVGAPANAIGLAVLATFVLVAVFAPVLAPESPSHIAVQDRLIAPSLGGPHFLGTDHLGRDIASRMIHGARVSLMVGIAVVGLSSLVGILLGLFGGYSARFGNVLMRIIDGMMSFPGIVFALALIAALGSSLINVILALSFVYVPRVARVVHASALSLRRSDFVVAAEALGGSSSRVAFVHLLPNTLGPVIVQSTFIFAYAVISEASLTFLGVGLPPGTASWGVILSEGRDFMREAPWITIFPGLAIFVLVLGLNLLGDGLRDLIDPRVRDK